MTSNSEGGHESATNASGQNNEHSNTAEEGHNGLQGGSQAPSSSDDWHVNDGESRVFVLGRMRNALDLLFPLIDLEVDLLNMVLRLSELNRGRSGTPPASKDSI